MQLRSYNVVDYIVLTLLSVAILFQFTYVIKASFIKITLLHVSGVLLLTLLLFKLAVCPRPLKFPPLFIFMIGLLLLFGISSLFSVNSVSSFQMFLNFVFIILLYIGFYNYLLRANGNQKIYLYFINACFIVAALSAAYSIYYTLDRYTVIFTPGRIRAIRRAASIFIGDPNYYGGYLTSMFPFGLVFYKLQKNLILKGLYLFGLLAIFIVLFFTMSRAAVLSLIVVSLGYLSLFYGRKLFIRKKTVKFVLFLAALLLLITFIFNHYSEQLSPFGFITDRLLSKNQAAQASIAERSAIAKVGLDLYDKSFPLGIGINTYKEASKAYWITHGIYAKVQHNTFLRLLVEAGIVTFFLYGTFLFLLMRKLYLAFKTRGDEMERSLLAGFILSFLGYFLMAMTLDQFFAPQFWGLLPAALYLANKDSQEKPDSHEDKNA